MANLLLIGVVALILGAILVKSETIRKAYYSPLSRIPGPWDTHLSNLRYRLASLTGNRIHYFHALHQKYGPIVRVSPTEISTCDADAFKTIHNTRNGYGKSDWYANFTSPERPNIFTMQDNKDHAVRRRVLAKGFQKTFLRTEWEGKIREKVQFAVDRIKEDAKANTGTVDMYKWWVFLSMDVAGLCNFGESFGTLDAGADTEFVRALKSRFMANGLGSALPLLRKIGPIIPSENFQMLFRNEEVLGRYLERAVENSKSGSSRNVFTQITSEAEKDDPKLTDADVRGEALNLTVAGSDTTGVTLSYLIWSVLKQPEKIQAPLEAELAALSDDDLNDATLEQLPVLGAVLNETLRLYTAAPGPLPRVVPSGGASLCGYPVPEGTVVSAPAWPLHRHTQLWGDDADVFDHTRWLPDSARISDDARAVFAPWGGMPHSCLGLNLAQMEIRLAAAHFFRQCRGARVSPVTTDAEMVCKNFFLNKPAGRRCMVTLR